MPGDERTAEDRHVNSGSERFEDASFDGALEGLDAQRPSPSNPPGGEPSPEEPSSGTQGEGPVNQVREDFSGKWIINAEEASTVDLQDGSSSTSDSNENPSE